MIKIQDISRKEPFQKFNTLYNCALDNNQNSIEAVNISSFNKQLQEVNSRLVNLKYIIDEDFIFFSNYNSPKSNEFESHDQISAVFFWPTINAQIRIKAKIFRTEENFSDKHYKSRSIEKNMLAHSSNQSEIISSYREVKENYHSLLDTSEIKSRPVFWGGFSFTPFYFEFWEGHRSRLNKREVFQLEDNEWKSFIIQP